MSKFSTRDFETAIHNTGVAYGRDNTRYMVTTYGDSWALEIISPNRRDREMLFACGVPFRTIQDVQRAACELASVS